MKKILKKFIFILIFILLVCISNKIQASEDNVNAYGAEVGSSLYDIMDHLEEYENITFYDKDDKKITDLSETVKTGMKMELSKSSETDNIYLEIYVRGDVDGNGLRDEEDLLLIKKQIVGLIQEEDINQKAMDSNDDEDVSLYDLYYNKEAVENKEEPEEVQDVDFELSNEKIDLDLGETIKIEAKFKVEDSNVNNQENNEVSSEENKEENNEENNEENTKQEQQDEANDVSIFWFSANTEVAKVDQEGLVTAVGNGTTLITAMTETGRMKSCEVTVTTSPKDIELSKEKIELYINSDYDKETISYTLKPEGVNVKNKVTCTVSDENIVSVNEQGVIEAKSNGNAKITLTTENGISKSCDVIVKTVPKDIASDKNEISIEKNETYPLNVRVLPETANYNTNIIYTSADETIATVDEKGIVKGISKGETTITASIYNDKKVEIKVSVFNTIKEINFNPESGKIDLTSGNEFSITATNEENIKINSELEWSSSNEEIATVDSQGKVTALKNGEVNIIARRGGVSQEFKLVVVTSPEGIELSAERGELQMGATGLLVATITPETANTNNELTWTSSNPENVTVDQGGKLTAIKPGSSIITVTTANGKKDSCLVKVKGNASGTLFTEDEILLKKETTKQAIINFTGETTIENISVTSSDNNIVSIQNYTLEEGKILINITGNSKGIATITANIEEQSETATVFVYESLEDIETKIKGNSIENNKYTIDLGESSPIFKIEALLNDIEINNKIQWSSSDEQIATIDENGEIYCLKNGTTTITAQINEEWTRQIELTIQTSPTGISMKVTSWSIYKNDPNEQRDRIYVTIPSNANVNNTITYSSSDTNIVKVDSEGKLTAVNVGNAEITATTGNGKTATCKLHVGIVPEGVNISDVQFYLKKGNSKKITATINPSGTTDLNILSYSSSNTGVARVDSNGNVTACGAGEAIITVTTMNGKQDTCKVIVPNLKLSAQTTNLYINGQNSAKLIASGNNIGNITYSSSNTNVAYVENGYVKAKGSGTCTITATEANAGVQATLKITVYTLATSVKLNATSASLDISNPNVSLSATIVPSNASNHNIKWYSTNTNVATVDSNGNVTRVGQGTADIIAQTQDGSGKNGKCTVTVKEEKVIIAGASTVVQMAGRRTIKANGTAYANIAYYRDYGYHVRTTEEWREEYYDYLTNYGTNDTNSDLFFVCWSGAGLKWLSGQNLTADYWATAGTSGEGIQKIERIVNNNKDCHFTIGVLLLGNDLTKVDKTETSKLENIANKYAAYYKELAKNFPNHEIFALTPTPTTNANTNAKRKTAIAKIQSKLSGSDVNFVNLYSIFENNSNYKTIDGKHYDKDTTKLVFKTILDNMGVLGSNGKKK